MASTRGSNQLPFHSGISSNKPPLFDGSNYSHWKYRMEIHLQSIDYELWEITVNGPHIPKKKNDKGEVEKKPKEYTREDKQRISLSKRALCILLCSLNATEHSWVVGARSTHDVWKKLKVTHERTTQVKKVKVTMLVNQFENFRMLLEEIIQQMSERYNDILSKLALLDTNFTEEQKVDKILRSLPKEWQPKVTAINEFSSLVNINLKEFMGNFLTHEIKMKQLEKDEVNTKKNLSSCG